MWNKDTIAAIATGLTDSGIGIVRISGKNAVEVGDRIFRSPSGRHILHSCESHRMHYGFAADEEKDFVADEVMAVVMRAPRSFTGEDTVEIQCHGGVLVMKKILETALKCGARMAEPGEFTKRAFLNGRVDLSRAEAVMDVIQSQTEYALASSVNQLKGVLSEKIKKMRGMILYEIAWIESAVDDPEHISLEGYSERLSGVVDFLCDEIQKLIATSDSGRFLREGINTVIVGKPNVGKSSFLNCLVGEERAIVTDVPGTTRDVLRETVRLGEISLNVMDTAGIRDTADLVEKIGVERAKRYVESADLVVYIADVSEELSQEDRDIASFLGDRKCIVLLNKCDLDNVITEEQIYRMFMENRPYGALSEMCRRFPEHLPVPAVRMSAKNGEGMDTFEKVVKEMFFHGKIQSSGETVLVNLRHKECLEKAMLSLTLVRESLEGGLPEDFYSIDLMDAYTSLGQIIGEEVGDDLVEEIFSKFCMGK